MFSNLSQCLPTMTLRPTIILPVHENSEYKVLGCLWGVTHSCDNRAGHSTLTALENGEKSSGSCCRCNKLDKCRSCAGVKASHCCTNCLPSHLGHCRNAPATSQSTTTPPVPVTSPSIIVTATPTSPLSTTGPPDQPVPQCQESLPSFKKSIEPSFVWSFVWGTLNGTTFKDLISLYYITRLKLIPKPRGAYIGTGYALGALTLVWCLY